MADAPRLRFSLDDGTPVVLRPLTPDDRERLLVGFAQLSDTTRRLRFIAPPSSLSDDQLDYLTEVDQYHHVAWGALDATRPEAPGLGVGRFVRLSETPQAAEFSLVVLDAVQGHGLGRLLLALLYALAPTVGIETLRGIVARDNAAMTNWLPRLGARLVNDQDSEVLFDLPVHVDLTRLPDREGAFGALVDTVRTQLERAGIHPQNET